MSVQKGNGYLCRAACRTPCRALCRYPCRTFCRNQWHRAERNSDSLRDFFSKKTVRKLPLHKLVDDARGMLQRCKIFISKRLNIYAGYATFMIAICSGLAYNPERFMVVCSPTSAG